MYTTSDHFAELYVAGLMAEAGWNVYFPHRDRGLDFIASKTDDNGVQIIRPVQVKGKYPSRTKTDKQVYGYVGRLNQVHPQMVLAISFLNSTTASTPLLVAYMPFSQVKPHRRRDFRCEPASFKGGVPRARREFTKFLNSQGLALAERPDWGQP